MKSSGTSEFWQRYRASPTPSGTANVSALERQSARTEVALQDLLGFALALAKAAACHADLSRQSLGVGGSLGEGGTPEPKRIAIGLITRKGKLSPAPEKFCQRAKDAFVPSR
jgi:hypothetical protein